MTRPRRPVANNRSIVFRRLASAFCRRISVTNGRAIHLQPQFFFFTPCNGTLLRECLTSNCFSNIGSFGKNNRECTELVYLTLQYYAKGLKRYRNRTFTENTQSRLLEQMFNNAKAMYCEGGLKKTRGTYQVQKRPNFGYLYLYLVKRLFCIVEMQRLRRKRSRIRVS